jgi:Tol biopolymer transport system component
MKTFRKSLILISTISILFFLYSCQSNDNLQPPSPDVQISASPTDVLPTNTHVPTPITQIQTPEVETITDLSRMIGTEVWPSWSPDGSKIIFANQNRETAELYGFNIYVMNADGSQQRMLKGNVSGKSFQYPSWSPDGQQIAYTEVTSEVVIKTMLADGTQDRTITTCDYFCTNPTWAPDGSNIIYLEYQDEWGKRGQAVINRYDLITNEEITIFQVDINDYIGGTDSASYSPDGNEIAFNIWDNTPVQGGASNAESTTYIIDKNGSNIRKIINAHTPSWSPDGSKLIFVMNTSNGEDLYISSKDGANLVRYTYGSYWSLENPSWSPDGSEIIFSAGTHLVTEENKQGEILVINARDASLVSTHAQQNKIDLNNLATDPLACPPNSEFLFGLDASTSYVEWSPASKQIAFVSSVDGDNDIYIMSSEGKDIRNLTNNEFDDYIFFWLPDSKSIAFESNDSGYFNLYLVKINGDNENAFILLAEDVGSFQISPNGNSIIYEQISTRQQGSSWDIYMMNADGTNKTLLIETELGSQDPIWSRDGKKIFFGEVVHTSIVVGNYWGAGKLIAPRIMSMNLDGTDIRLLTDSNSQDRVIGVSPDGQSVLFRSDREQYNVFKVYIMDTNGENEKKLTDMMGRAYWSPFSEGIIFTQTDPEGGKINSYILDENGTSIMDLPEIFDGEYYFSPDVDSVIFPVETEFGKSYCEIALSDLLP